jgi:hypothetical protein
MQRFDWFCLTRSTLFFIESQELISTGKPHFAPLAPLGDLRKVATNFTVYLLIYINPPPSNQARSMVLPQSLFLRH